MLKKREPGQTETWVIRVPATGFFFALVQATDQASARAIATQNADSLFWFAEEDLGPGELSSAFVFVDAGGTYSAMAENADDGEDEDEDGEDENIRDVPRG